MRRGRLAACAFASLLAFAAGALAAEGVPEAPGVVRATLSNGLKVVIVADRLAPVVTTVVNYIVGADETPPGFPGMAHAQEHMMFRGSPDLSAEQLAAISTIVGGNSDADTRQTVTQYDFTVPAKDLDLVLNIEAARMRGVLDDLAGWADERKAIEQEVAQDLSSPRYVLSTRLREALFKGTPYEHDALGTRPSFDATTADMLKEFHAKWYAPNNAVLVIAGDVDPTATLARVKALFEGIPAKELPARPPLELGPPAAETITLDSDLPYGLAVLALRMPGLDSPDWAAVEILGDVLTSQRGALFSLVPDGKALDAEFSYDAMPRAGFGEAMVAFPEGGDPAALIAEAKAIIANIAKTGVPPDLVAAAKRQERRGIEFQKNSISELAFSWSEAVAVDGRASPEAELAELEQVTVDDVNRVAQRYLDLDHAVTAILTPRRSGQPVSSHGFGGREQISLGETKPVKLPDWAASALDKPQAPDATLHPVDMVLANGIRLIVQPEAIGQTVSVFGRIRNRPELQVPKDKDGLTQVLDQLFGYGSETLDRIAFQTALDSPTTSCTRRCPTRPSKWCGAKSPIPSRAGSGVPNISRAMRCARRSIPRTTRPCARRCRRRSRA
jgi:zinc protease